MRRLEKEYIFTPVTPSKDSVRLSHTKGEMEYALRTGKPSAKMVLQKMAEFTRRLKKCGVELLPNVAGTGRISGICYRHNNIIMKFRPWERLFLGRPQKR